MSSRELKSLISNQNVVELTGTRSGRRLRMSEGKETEQESQLELEAAKVLLVEKEAELQSAGAELRRLEQERDSALKEAQTWQSRVEQVRMEMKLSGLRTIERLRTQHEAALEKERTRYEEWLRRGEDSWKREKQLLEDRLATFQAELEAVRMRPSTEETPVITGEVPPTVEEETPLDDGTERPPTVDDTAADAGAGEEGHSTTERETVHPPSTGHTDESAVEAPDPHILEDEHRTSSRVSPEPEPDTADGIADP